MCWWHWTDPNAAAGPAPGRKAMPCVRAHPPLSAHCKIRTWIYTTTNSPDILASDYIIPMGWVVWNSSMPAWCKVILGSGVSKKIHLTKSPRQEYPKESCFLGLQIQHVPPQAEWEMACWASLCFMANDNCVCFPNHRSQFLMWCYIITSVYIGCYIAWFVEELAGIYDRFWSGAKYDNGLGFSRFSFQSVVHDLLS